VVGIVMGGSRWRGRDGWADGARGEAGEQGLERGPGVVLGGGVLQEPVGEVERQHDAVEVGGDLAAVHVGAEPAVAGAHDGLDGRDQRAVVRGEPVANRTGLLVELGGRLDEEADAGLAGGAAPDPPVEQGADPRFATWGLQRRADHGVREPGRRLVEHRELERLLGPEVGVEAALREPGARRQLTDRQPSEPDPVGGRDAVVDDRLAGSFALGVRWGGHCRHPGENSTIVRFCPWSSGRTPRRRAATALR